MSIFDSIDAKKIVSEKEVLYRKKNLADARIAEYYQIKLKIYMEFFQGFSKFAIKEKLPLKTHRSTEAFGKKFIGWKIAPDVGISQEGECYVDVNGGEPWRGVFFKKCEMTDVAIAAADIIGGKRKLECYYDSLKDVIHIKGVSGDNVLEMSIPDEEYYSKIEVIIKEKLKKYCESVVNYILSS